MPIRVLPIALVNKIAAGEVIERPASVVKELVENSLDAGAAAIDVAIEDGGRRLIRVTDDGGGMTKDDLTLAFEPHATSKIASEDDLFAIRTMGFRGEALASIAAVSRAHIRTRKSGQEPFSGSSRAADSSAGGNVAKKVPDPLSADAAGYEIEAEGGQVSPVRPCAATVGTTITVRDLFYNVPARRKFLRTAATEIGHVSEQLIRLALAHPRVAFSLSHTGRSMLRLPAAAGTLERARDAFGEELAAGLMPIVQRGGAVRVAGLIGTPSAARASGKWQYFFLNGRYIRDRLLAHALREAYRGACDSSRWPVGLIFVEIDPAEVDVNVHPTKIEVRFRDGDRVHGEVLAALRDTLNRAPVARASLDGARAPGGAGAEAPGGGTESVAGGAGSAGALADAEQGKPVSPANAQRRESLRQAMVDFFKSAVPRQPQFSFPESRERSSSAASPQHTGHQAPSVTAPPQSNLGLAKPQADGQTVTASDRPSPETDASPPVPAGASSGDREQQPFGFETDRDLLASSQGHEDERGAGAALGAGFASNAPGAVQVHDSYILAGCADGVLIIDQHALHERILYNELKRRVESGDGLEGQRLLIPAPLRVSQAEAAALAAQEPLLRRLGVEVAAFGPDRVAVQQWPSLLVARGVQPAEFLRELLDKLTESPGAGLETILEDVLAMMACKAAVKAGQPLSPAEIESLLRRAELAERSFACPHGRPSVLKLTLKDLERQFKRS